MTESIFTSGTRLPDLRAAVAQHLPDLSEAIQREQLRRARNKIDRWFPDTGPLRRELYPRQLEMFAAGTKHRERLFMAANRVGKTQAGAYEMAMHLTGEYPAWWPGKRWTRPVKAWAAGQSAKTTRDIIQEELLGPWGQFGTGMLRGDRVGKWTYKGGVSEAVEIIHVKHASGGWSKVSLKSYDQGIEAFMGTAQDFIWLDEEPPLSVYSECLLRTMTTNGLVLITFTPLLGFSEVVKMFLEIGEDATA